MSHDDEHYSFWRLIAVTLAALLLFAAFFVSFLIAPLAILLIFYVAYSAADRRGRQRPQALAHEHERREEDIARGDVAAGRERAGS